MAALTPPIVSEVKLTYNPKVRAADRPHVINSMDSEAILREYWSNDIHLLEEFNFLMLDRGNNVLGFSNAAKGGIVGVMVDPRLIFVAALKARAVAIILAHNHPSGQLRASAGDMAVTRRMVQAGQLLDIQIIDHIILAPEGGFYSFADDGLIHDYSEGD
jgi:DNA repair protein RadC